MKKIIVATLAIGLLASAGIVSAELNPEAANNTPGAGIKGTSHDLSTGSFVNPNDTLNRICIYCHAPHHTVLPEDAILDQVGYVPLWNHDITIQEYEYYSNGADDPGDQAHQSFAEEEAIANNIGVGSVSRLCLSCHDGTVAANQYGYNPSASQHEGTMDVKGSKYEIGAPTGEGLGNLRNHHPVGFDYSDVFDDENENTRGEIADETTGKIGVFTIQELLWGGRMECSTCHDVHNSQNSGEKFLWVSDTGSALCLSCHLK